MSHDLIVVIESKNTVQKTLKSCAETTDTTTYQDAASGRSFLQSPSKQEKAGYLHTYSSKTFLGREKWKQRYYILCGNKLYRFYKKEDSCIDDGKFSKGRIINLDLYDICQHVCDGGHKKDNVFILDGANSGNVPTKYIFATDTAEDMQDWISNLRKALFRSRENRRPQRPPRSKVTSVSSSSRKSQKSDVDEEPLADPNTPTRLYSVTKYRVRGPKGRRLPQKKSRQFRDGNDKYISNSLCELDSSLSDENLTRPSRLHRASANTPPLGDRAKSSSFGNLAYQYSSSEESLFKERLKNTLKQSEVTRIEESDSEVSDSGQGTKVTTPDNIPICGKVVLDNGDKGLKPDCNLTVEEGVECLSSDQETSRQSVGPLIYLSAKLLELSNCLTRFRRHATDELHAAKEHLADIKKKLLDCPSPGAPTIDAISNQAAIVMMDLKSTEDDLEALANLTSKIEKSLQEVKDRCDAMLNKI